MAGPPVIKVYAWNYDGRVECIVATTSWQKAADAGGSRLSSARNYGSITGNKSDIDAAMKTPGVAVYRPISLPGPPQPHWYKPTAQEARLFLIQEHKRIFGSPVSS